MVRISWDSWKSDLVFVLVLWLIPFIDIVPHSNEIEEIQACDRI